MKSYAIFALLTLTACIAPAGDQVTEAEEPTPVYISTWYNERPSEGAEWTRTVESTEQAQGKYLVIEVMEGPDGWIFCEELENNVGASEGKLWYRERYISDENGERLFWPTLTDLLNYAAAHGYEVQDRVPAGRYADQYTFSR